MPDVTVINVKTADVFSIPNEVSLYRLTDSAELIYFYTLLSDRSFLVHNRQVTRSQTITSYGNSKHIACIAAQTIR